jgi:hypothetical protein
MPLNQSLLSPNSMEGGLYVCAQADLLSNKERKTNILCSEDVWGLPKELESRLTQQFGGFIRRLRYSFLVQSDMKRNGSEILFTRNKCVLSLCFASNQTSKEC